MASRNPVTAGLAGLAFCDAHLLEHLLAIRLRRTLTLRRPVKRPSPTTLRCHRHHEGLRRRAVPGRSPGSPRPPTQRATKGSAEATWSETGPRSGERDPGKTAWCDQQPSKGGAARKRPRLACEPPVQPIVATNAGACRVESPLSEHVAGLSIGGVLLMTGPAELNETTMVILQEMPQHGSWRRRPTV